MYRVRLPNGAIAECESAEAALALDRAMAGRPPMPQSTARVGPNAPVQNNPGLLAEKRAELNDVQRRILDILAAGKGTAVAMGEMANVLGIKATERKKLGGTIAGLMKTLTRIGIEPDTVIVRTSTGTGLRRVVEYRAGPLLLQKGGSPQPK